MVNGALSTVKKELVKGLEDLEIRGHAGCCWRSKYEHISDIFIDPNT